MAEDLLTPLVVKGMRIRNRLVMPPMATDKAGDDGSPAPAHIEHYRKRAAAGVGLVILEHCFVALGGRLSRGQPGIHCDEAVYELAKIVRAVKDEGAAVAIQLNHAGSAASGDPGCRRVGPSVVPHPTQNTVPEEMSPDEIAGVVAQFASAAGRAVRAGFDAVEIHGAHGYLLGQFLSPLTNRREDRYGGSAENRMRFPLEVIRAVRDAVGPDYPVLYRLGAWDGMQGGLVLGDTRPISPHLVEAGVDILDVSGGFCGSRPAFLQGVQGYYVPLAAAIRKESGVPVICAGGITEPEFANRLVKYGRVDLVGVGRPMLADADWARLALEKVRDAG